MEHTSQQQQQQQPESYGQNSGQSGPQNRFLCFQSSALLLSHRTAEAATSGHNTEAALQLTSGSVELEGLGSNIQVSPPGGVMGSNYPDALADFMETAARPLENAHETAPGTRIYNREYFVTPRAQTHPGDVSFTIEFGHRGPNVTQREPPNLRYHPHNGEIVPQEQYVARSQYFETVERIAISSNGRPGIRLGPVLQGDFQGLEQAEEQESFENFNQKVYYRIKWSDYPPFSAAKHVKKTRNGNVRCITRREIVVQVAEVTQAFIQKYSRYNTQDDTWRVGPSFIELQDLILIALDKVSNGSVQPVYKLARV